MSVQTTILHLPPEYFGRTAPRHFPGKFQLHPSEIHNARLLSRLPKLDEDKICIVPHTSKVTDWMDTAHVERVWYREISELMKDLIGCVDVVFVGHLIRDHTMTETSAQTSKQSFYATFAHNDTSAYTCHDHVGMYDQLRGRHWAQYNIWRSIDQENPVLDNPLAVLHPASTTVNDLVLTEDPPTLAVVKAAKQGNHEAMKRLGSYAPFRLVANSRHKWFYFDKMNADEALIFLQWDTRETRPTMQQVFHSSFKNPLVPASAPQRKSCEVRMFCIFDEKDHDFDGNVARIQAQYPPMPKARL